MGNMRAYGMREAVEEGWCSLEAAIVDHLTANLFRPVTEKAVPNAIQAIKYCDAGEYDAVLTRPDGTPLAFPDGTIVTAGMMVEDLHLEAFLDMEEI